MALTDQVMFYQVGGKSERASYSFFRGEHCNFYPNDSALEAPGFIESQLKGLAPETPFITKQSKIVAFGSCFAEHIAKHLHAAGYNVATKKDQIAYISLMGDGIVNTSSILQQFMWAWENSQPKSELWHGYDAKAFGYDEEIRLATKAVLDDTDVFIITLGLSEVWYDSKTSEVFWRAVPQDKFDGSRHHFRVMSQSENVDNIDDIVDLIRKHRPDARVIFTLSPIPLTATFRNIAALVANGASKANLRSAIDEAKVDYFPSYELVTSLFHHQFMEDRKHIHRHVIEFMMSVFETCYCGAKIDLDKAFVHAQGYDRQVGQDGHWSVPRASLKWSKA